MKTLTLLFSFAAFCSYSQTFTRSELSTPLEAPWEIIYGPDGYLWLSEYGGKVVRVHPETGDKQVVFTAFDSFDGDPSESLDACFNPAIQAGTLGLALHPDFMDPDSAFIYLIYSYNASEIESYPTKFKIRRLKWNHQSQTVESAKDIVSFIPTSYDHIGGRLLAVKREGRNFLYLSIGDHGLSELNSPTCYEDQSLNPNNFAQDPSTMNGKIHRFNMDGSIPFDNPIAGNSFYTRGHRNPQGLMYNKHLDILYEVEHGDRTDDEINILMAGMNYGWKNVRGYHDGNFPGELDYISNYEPNDLILNDALIPAIYSWCDDVAEESGDNSLWCTVAPSDGIYYSSTGIPQWNNSLLVVTLKSGINTSQEVYQFKLDSKGQIVPSTAENPNPTKYFGEDQALNGRLRDICISPDGKKIFIINSGGAPTSKITVYTVDETSINPGGECGIIFPNPVTDVFSIDGFDEEVQCDIFTLQGQLIFSELVDPAFVNVSLLKAGTYTVKISNDTKSCGLKLVKMNVKN